MYDQADLNNFRMRWETYINQFFGDRTIRKIIEDEYPNRNYTLTAVDGDPTWHHILEGRTRRIAKWCSMERGIQDDNNPNDNLCQTYSLLKYMYPNRKIPSTMKGVANSAVEMYRLILSNSRFMKTVDNDILQNREVGSLWDMRKNNVRDKYGDAAYWVNYSKDEKPLPLGKKMIVKNIRAVLTDWKKYGWESFMP